MAHLYPSEQAKIDLAETLETALRCGERFIRNEHGHLISVTEASVKEAQQIAENMRCNAEIGAE